MQCDFCTSPGPTWTFQAGPSQTEVLGGMFTDKFKGVIDLGDGWCACDTCAEMIRQDKRDDLRDRAIVYFLETNPEFRQLDPTVIGMMVTMQHHGFWRTKLDDGVREIIRMEFGHKRTTCACDVCVTNCKNMPGMLLPSDLERMTAGMSLPDIEAWANKNLLASPGALARNRTNGEVFRVPTLVPAIKPDGSCIHLTPENRCAIHEVAPFGCAFFDCTSSEDDDLSGRGVMAIMQAHVNGDLYSDLWQMLFMADKVQKAPEILRATMRRAS